MGHGAKRLTRAEQVEQNRERLLASALAVFLREGYERATLDTIAEEAGLSKGAIYSQFDGKADLLLALLDRRIAERAAQNAQIAARHRGFEALIELIRASERDSRTAAGWTQLLLEFRLHAARHPDLNRRYAQAHARTRAGIARTIAELYDRAGQQPPIPAADIADLVLAVGSGVFLERLADPDALPEPTVRPAIERMLAAGVTGTPRSDGPPGTAKHRSRR